MAKAKHTYAVRLAVEGGNRVKADLTSVGASGERSIKKIDRASDRASRGLGTLGDRASSLRRNMRLLGGVVAGVAAGGGLALLVKRSIDAADSIAKTADAIGISTDALQELRFAADLSGVSVESLDKALKFATKAIGELRTRTSSELTTALKNFDAQLLRNIESAGSVEEAINLVFRRMGEMEDATQKAALAKSVFGRAGIDLVNIVRGEAGALEEMRQHARDLGIVLDEELLRNAEKTKDQLTVLGTVLSANLNKAILEHADAIGDLAEQFTEALPTLIGWVSSFGQWIGLIEQTKTERLAEIREEIAEIDEAMQNWFRRALEWSAIDAMLGNEQNGPLKRKRAALVAELADLERQIAEAAQTPLVVTPAATPAGSPTAATLDDPVMTAEQQARRLVQIEKSLNQQLFQLRYQGAERIRAEHLKLVTELQHLIKPDGSNLDEVERLLIGAAAVRDDKLVALARREQETADRRTRANQRILEGLRAEQEALAMTDRQRFVSQALRRLSAEATEEQRRQVEALAGALFDERQAEEARDRAGATVAELEAERAALGQTDRQRFISQALRQLSAEATEAQRQEVRTLAGALHDEQRAIEARNEAEREANRLRAEGEALTERLRTAQEAYADEIERLRELLDAGAIDQETFGRASEEADDRMLRSSREWSDGVRRAIRDYLDEATDAAKTFEQATTRALKASEDAFVEWAMTGKFSAKDLFNTIAEEALRAAYRMAVVAPLNNILGSIFGAIGGSIFGGTGVATTSAGTPMIGDFPVPSGPTAFAHGGGVIGRDAFPARMVDPAVFDRAARYHRGGIVGGERPIVARSGEGVFTPGQMQALAPISNVKPVVHVAVNVRNTAPGARASADVRREPGGDLTLDIMIERIEGGMARHIGRGEGLAPTLERRYGLNPAAGSLR